MTNYEFCGLRAGDVAKKIIDCEEKYLNTDYSSLSFEDKCLYAVEYTPLCHFALAPNPKKRAEMLDELRPELLRRAENEDPFALFVLGCRYTDLSDLSTEEERRYFERSLKEGYLPAAFMLLDFFHRYKDESESASKLRAYIAERAEECSSDTELYYCYLFTEDDRLLDVATRLASEGFWSAVGHIQQLDVSSECKSFWLTVEFLVYDYFYGKGAEHVASSLGMKLVNERGCELDRDKLAEVFFGLISRFRYDRQKLQTIIETKEEGAWKSILTTLISGDRDALWSACCCIAHTTDYKELARAYMMLCGARARD